MARSPEAKALGLPRGAPWFECRDLARQHGVVALSSNYPLYADLSARLMAVLGRFAPRQAIYSIDECFLDLSGGEGLDPTATGQAIRRRVDRGLGLPVAVGIGPTPTLAKLANHLAQQEPEWVGVCDWAALDPSAQDARLAGLAVEETWGIGPRWGARLRADGLATVRDLRAADPANLGGATGWSWRGSSGSCAACPAWRWTSSRRPGRNSRPRGRSAGRSPPWPNYKPPSPTTSPAPPPNCAARAVRPRPCRCGCARGGPGRRPRPRRSPAWCGWPVPPPMPPG